MKQTSGTISSEAIAGANRIIGGADLSNPEVIRALTADGSNIADWGKYATQTANGPSGPFQVHFYYNPVTGAANYANDFKVVFNHNGVWR